MQIISDEKGRRFPHPGIEAQLLAPNEEAQNIYQAAFGDGQLQNEIHDYLQMPRCQKATPFVEINFLEQAENSAAKKKGFLLHYITRTSSPDTAVFLEIIEGHANPRQMRLVNEITYIGRGEKVVNKHGGIERINDLYFPDLREIKERVSKELKDVESINNSVSRLHAHIKAVDGDYFLFDDKSSRGTSVLPGGRGTSEFVDTSSGKKLSNNDIISFGKAIVKVRVVKKK